MGAVLISCLSGYGVISIPLSNFSYIDKETLSDNYIRLK